MAQSFSVLELIVHTNSDFRLSVKVIQLHTDNRMRKKKETSQNFPLDAPFILKLKRLDTQITNTRFTYSLVDTCGIDEPYSGNLPI